MTTTLIARRVLPVIDEPADDATRRQFMSVIAAGLGLTLGACADDTGDDGRATTRTFTDALGNEVEIPVAPQRIVAIDASRTLQILDELGAPLVGGGALGGGVRIFVGDETRALPVTSDRSDQTKVLLEAVVKVRPDLITGQEQFGEEFYDQLSAIAPTALVPAVGRSWLEIYRSLAEVVGRADRVSKPLAALNRRTEELQSAIRKAWPDGVIVNVLRIDDPTMATIRPYTTYGRQFISSALLGELDGVTVAADSLPGAEEGSVILSSERLREVDADLIFYYHGGGALADADTRAMETALKGTALWPSLTAVKSGRAYQVDSGRWRDGGDFEAANLLIDDLFKYLT
jgi:iron complex transport system substrate-binding protein